MAWPKSVDIREEGPREGFQFEKGHIPTVAKVALIDALSETGLRHIQAVSFVNPKRVPGWADAEAVVAAMRRKEGVHYTGLWLNLRGFQRALATGRLDLEGSLGLTASEAFAARNIQRTRAEDIAEQRALMQAYAAAGVPVTRVSVMAAFGCNYMGEVPAAEVMECVRILLDMAAEAGAARPLISLADTMAWANPADIKRLVGAVQDAWPENPIALHLHDTRGLAIADALAGLEMGVRVFDSAVAGLGGCPFAKHAGAAGNICTEDLVFLCHELGIETGVDLERLGEVGRLAEEVVGHKLPGKLKDAGGLAAMRRQAAAA
ncbi:MAG TPA: hydroxymethylglutaryl-CoA lyase [Roseomonas sp.]|nr:hydroxymethylglutaryl-CoA lyase [Roseomonas sp.]